MADGGYPRAWAGPGDISSASRPGHRPGRPGYLGALLSAAAGASEAASGRRVRAPFRPAWRPDVEPLADQGSWLGPLGGEPAVRSRPGPMAITSPGAAQAGERSDAAGTAPGPRPSETGAPQPPAYERAGSPGRTWPAHAARTSFQPVAGPEVRARRPPPAGDSPLGRPETLAPGPLSPADSGGLVPPRPAPGARPEGPTRPPSGSAAAAAPTWRSRSAGDVDDGGRATGRRPAPSPTRAVLPERPAAATLPLSALEPSPGPTAPGRAAVPVPAVHIGVVEVRVLTPAPPVPTTVPRARAAAEAGRGPGQPVRFFGLAQG